MKAHRMHLANAEKDLRATRTRIAPIDRVTGRNTMEKKGSYARNSSSDGSWRRLGAGVLGFLLMLAVGQTALAQNVTVSGTVTSAGGTPLPGATVRVQGTDVRTLTDGIELPRPPMQCSRSHSLDNVRCRRPLRDAPRSTSQWRRYLTSKKWS